MEIEKMHTIISQEKAQSLSNHCKIGVSIGVVCFAGLWFAAAGAETVICYLLQ
jgi:hypothetical protein